MKAPVAPTWLVPCALVLLGTVAHAQEEQPWLQDREYREGMGFRTGDFEIHPGVGAEFGYDSNYYQRADSEDPIGSLRLRLSPSISVATLGPQRSSDGAPPPSVEFRSGLSGTYLEFIPLTGSDTDKETLRDQRNVSGDFGISLSILPRRPWSGRLAADVGRVVQPTNEFVFPGATFNRWTPAGTADLRWTPHSGLFDWQLGYRFAGTFFEASVFQNLNNFENEANTRGRWRFLPKTALFFDGRVGFVTYPVPLYKTASYPVRAQLGANGLITPSFGLLVMAGWGSSFYAGDREDFDSVVGQAELKWYLTPSPAADQKEVSLVSSALVVGFTRDFEDSYVGTYLERDRGYAKLTYFIGGTFLLDVEAGAAAVLYPPLSDYGQPKGWT
ncbi:MAG: hypothetical protein HY744_18575, partial [Deltaproteobacteria bacterium]|nr:hypothetical protein [Deltaproteobacteria bacterium]